MDTEGWYLIFINGFIKAFKGTSEDKNKQNNNANNKTQ